MTLETNQSVLEPLKKVTPLSKYFALSLFVVLPFVAGWIGYNLAPATDNAPIVVSSEEITFDTTEATTSETVNDSNEVIYNTVFVSNWGDTADNYKFLENSGSLYIFHSVPFDGGSILKKIEGVTKFTELNYYKFEHIGASYIKDDTYVIFAGEGFNTPTLLIEADPASFSLSTSTAGQVFGIDNDSVYFRGEHLGGVNPTTMKVISSDNYKLGIVYDEDTFWFPEGNCSIGSYRLGTESEIEGFIFPC